MSRFRLELVSSSDDADLRRVLAETPMGGRIAVTFRREPSYFGAAVVDGRFRQVVAARDLETDRIVGFGSRAVSERYVNGAVEPVGYLSSLRLLAAYRNRGLLARGYAYFRRLHADGRTNFYLTTIAEGNEAALAILTSGRAGLPAYHYAGQFHTAALPLARSPQPLSRESRKRGRGEGADCGIARGHVAVRPAREEDIPEVLGFLNVVGPRRQFFPVYEPHDFLGEHGTFQDFRMADLMLAYRHRKLVGTLAGWDQHGFRQTVVHAYTGMLSWGRAPYNCLARLRSFPRLPRPGECLRYLTAAVPVVDGDDPEVFAALLEALLNHSAAGPWSYLLLGLHEYDPLLAVVRSYRATWYTTRLYLVCWEDGEVRRAALDGRPPHLELGCL
jgi:hypothetical protein